MSDREDQLMTTRLRSARSTYAASGFGGDLGFGRHPALLVVDLIAAFTDPGSPLGMDLDQQIAAAGVLKDAVEGYGGRVVFSTVAYDSEAMEMALWPKKIPALRRLVDGSPAVQLDSRLTLGPGQRIIKKEHASCFFGTDLAAELRADHVDGLIIVGCTTCGCVRATAVDASAYGFPTVVVSDAVGDRDGLSHEVSLMEIQAKYADVWRLEQVLEHLSDRDAAAN